MNTFKIPKGYTCWCHQCGEPPFNKVTMVEEENKEHSMDEIGLKQSAKMIPIPGVGFTTLDELTKHTRDVHRTWKG